MKEIKLTQGKVALVDDEDYEYLNQWKWTTNKLGKTYYALRTINRKDHQECILMHRVIMSTPIDQQVDHFNHNGLDNQKINLRNCSRSENLMNITPRGTSKYLGVSYCSRYMHYRAQIRINGKPKHIGYYKNEIEAALAFDAMAIQRGIKINLNFK